MREAFRSGLILLACCVTTPERSTSKPNVDMSTRYVLSSRDSPNERCIAVLFRSGDGCIGTASTTRDGHGDDVNALCPNTTSACGALIDCHCGVVDAGTRALNLYVYSDCGDSGDAGPFSHEVEVVTESDAGSFEVCKRREAYKLGDWY